MLLATSIRDSSCCVLEAGLPMGKLSASFLFRDHVQPAALWTTSPPMRQTDVPRDGEEQRQFWDIPEWSCFEAHWNSLSHFHGILLAPETEKQSRQSQEAEARASRCGGRRREQTNWVVSVSLLESTR